MKIKLELEDYRFATTICPQAEVRWLIVDVGGRPYSVYRTMDPQPFRSKLRDEQIDRILVEQMQVMLEKILVDACAAIPPGTEILTEK